MHSHLVLRESSGLIGTNHRSRTHRFASMHFTNQIIIRQHTLHTHRQTERDTHRQSFGDSHDDNRNSYHRRR